MAEFDIEALLLTIDEYLSELGTSGIIDGRLARDRMLDVRSLVSSMKPEEAMEEETV